MVLKVLPFYFIIYFLDIILTALHNMFIQFMEVTMKVLTIRNVPEDLYKIIARLARQNRRSIQQQTLTILDRARILDDNAPVEKAAKIRFQLAGRKLGNTIKELREERSR